VGEADALTNLGVPHERQGRLQQATDLHRQALALYRRIGDRNGQARALNGLGEASQAADRPAEARDHHTVALDITHETGDRYEQARAHAGLAHAHHRSGDHDRARRQGRRARTLYADLGAPEPTEITALLDDRP
jgi:tetratricopeptide (TPR) repeat protein